MQVEPAASHPVLPSKCKETGRICGCFGNVWCHWGSTWGSKASSHLQCQDSEVRSVTGLRSCVSTTLTHPSVCCSLTGPIPSSLLCQTLWPVKAMNWSSEYPGNHLAKVKWGQCHTLIILCSIFLCGIRIMTVKMRILISCFLSWFNRLFFPAHLRFGGKISSKCKIKVTLQSKFSVLMWGFKISETQETFLSTGRKLFYVDGNFSKLIFSLLW